jgi:hypothetical protein
MIFVKNNLFIAAFNRLMLVLHYDACITLAEFLKASIQINRYSKFITQDSEQTHKQILILN